MTTLIVGCGYLGRRVGRRLLARGERVLGTARSTARGDELAAIGIEPIVADVLDFAPLDHLPAYDRVLYCVGFDRSAGKTMRDVYVNGLRRFLDHSPHPIERFVYASSTGVYGQEDGSWIDEATAAQPAGESGAVVLDAENEIRAWNPASVIVRYVGLYGPRRVIGRSQVERGEPLTGNPERWLNLIHIDDASAIAVAALLHPGEGLHSLYLAADDRPVRRREYYELVASTLGAPAPSFVPDGREEPNKRVSNRLAKADFGLVLAYPDISTGLPASVAEERSQA